MLETLEKLRIKKIPINIISHKTRVPYLGAKVDLHAAAKNWLTINHFFDTNGLNLKENQIYFEVTKEEKIDRIMANGCTHYVDDLPEILEMIPKGIQKILFSPNSRAVCSNIRCSSVNCSREKTCPWPSCKTRKAPPRP